MRKLGSSSLILMAIVLIILGLIVRSNAIEWLVVFIINMIGFGLIIAGIIAGVLGIIGLMKNRESSY